MEEIDGLKIKVSADAKQFTTSTEEMLENLRVAVAQLNNYGDAVTSVYHKIERVAGLALPTLSFAGLSEFLSQVKNTRSYFQDIESTMRVFLGNAEKAAGFVKDLEDAAYYNMFDFEQLVEGSKQMIAYGVATDQVIDRINQLSEIATATHAPLMELIGSYNRAKSIGFVDNRMMQSFAVKGLVIKDVLKEMGENANVTRISFDQLNKVLDHVTAEGGMFHGVMNEQMHNISAEIGQLEDNLSLMKNEIGESLEEPLSWVVRMAGKLVEHWKEVAMIIAGVGMAWKGWDITSNSIADKFANELKEAEKELKKFKGEELKLDKDISDAVGGGHLSKKAGEELQRARNEAIELGKGYDENTKNEIERRKNLTKQINEQTEAVKKLNEEYGGTNSAIDQFKTPEKYSIDGLDDFKESGIGESTLNANQLAWNDLEQLEQSMQSKLEATEKEIDINQQLSEEYAKQAELLNKQVEEKEEEVSKWEELAQLAEEAGGDDAEDTMSEALSNAAAAAAEAETLANDALAASELSEMAAEEASNLEKQKGVVVTNMEAVAEQKAKIATDQKRIATDMETASQQKNTLATKMGTVAKTAWTTASNIARTATQQFTKAVKGLWMTLQTNPLGMLVSALSIGLPWLMSWLSGTEETTEEMDEFGKEAVETKSKVESLYLILETADHNSKIYKDTLKELTQISKGYNLSIDYEKDVTEQLIEKKKDLIRLIKEEGRQKRLKADIDKIHEENNDLIYGGGDDDDSIKKKYKEIASHVEGIEKWDLDNYAEMIAEKTEENAEEIAKKIQELREKRAIANGTATTQADREQAKQRIRELEDEIKDLTGQNEANQYLKDKDYNTADLEYKLKYSNVLKEIEKNLGTYLENQKALQEKTGKYIEGFNAAPEEQINKNDPEALAKQLSNANENVKQAKSNMESFNKTLKENEKESQKDRTPMIDAKKTKQNTQEVSQDLSKVGKEAEKTADKTKAAAEDMKKTPLVAHGDASQAEKVANAAIKSVKATADSAEEIKNSPLEIKAKLDSVEEFNQAIKVGEKYYASFKDYLDNNPSEVAIENAQVVSANELMAALYDKGIDISDYTVITNVESGQIVEGKERADLLENGLSSIDRARFNVNFNYSQLQEALNVARDLATVLTVIDPEKYSGKSLFFAGADRHVFGNISRYMKEKDSSLKIEAGMTVDQLKANGVWDKMDPWMQRYWSSAWNNVMMYNYSNGVQLTTEDAIKRAALVQGARDYNGNLNMEHDFVKYGKNKDGKQTFTIDTSKMDAAQQLWYADSKVRGAAQNNKDALAEAQKQSDAAWADFAAYYSAAVVDKTKTVEELGQLRGDLNNASKSLTPTDARQAQITKWLKQLDETSKIPGRSGGKGGGGSKDDPNQRKYEWEELVRKQDRQNKRAQEDIDFSIREMTLNMLDSSYDVDSAKAQLSYDQTKSKVERQLEDTIEQLRNEDMQRWLKDPKNKGKKAWQWAEMKANGTDKLTDEDYLAAAKSRIAYDMQIQKADYDLAEQQKELNDKRAENWRSWAKEYGNLKQKELAITQEYDKKIAEAWDDNTKRLLKAQKEDALKKLTKDYTDGIKDFLASIGDWDDKLRLLDERLEEDLEDAGDNIGQRLAILQKYNEDVDALNMEKLADELNWEEVFGNIDYYSTQALERMRKGLVEALNVKNITAENAKVIMDQLNELDKEMRRRKNVWGELFRSNPIGGLILGNKDRERIRKEHQDNAKTYANIETNANMGVDAEILKLREMMSGDERFSQYMDMDAAQLLGHSDEIMKIWQAPAGENKEIKEYLQRVDAINADNALSDEERQNKIDKLVKPSVLVEQEQQAARFATHQEETDKYNKAVEEINANNELSDEEKEKRISALAKPRSLSVLEGVTPTTSLINNTSSFAAVSGGAKADFASGIFSAMGIGMQKASDAKKEKEKEQKTADDMGNPMSKMDTVGAVVYGINDMVQSSVDLMGQFVDMDGTFGDGMKSFAESSQYATAAFDSLKNGDIMGVANNAINALGSLGDALGSWGVPGFGSSDKNLMHDLEQLARVEETLTYAIQELSEELQDSTFSESFDVYEEMTKNMQKTMENMQEGMQRSVAAYNNGFLGIKGKHSSLSKINDAMSPELWEEVSNAVGHSVTDASAFFSLTSEEMHKVKTYATNAWTEIRKAADEGAVQAGEYMDKWVEYYKQVEEAERQFHQKLTQTTFDSVSSNFKSMLLDMQSSAYDFANSFEEMMKTAVINSMVSDLFDTELEEWYKDFAKSMENGLDLDEQESLRRRYDEMANRAIEERKKLDDMMGWTQNEAARGTSGGGFATASQDSIDELNGRFTAVQIDTSAIRAKMDMVCENTLATNVHLQSLAEGMSAMRQYGQLHLEELQAINKNTQQLYSMNTRLEQIEKNTAYL